MDTKKEKSLVLIKPDGVQRALIGEILKRYEQTGLKLIGLKMLVPTVDLVERHYLSTPGWKVSVGKKALGAYEKSGKTPPSQDLEVLGETVLDHLRRYITSGPVIAMVWEGMNATGVIKKITGGTEPLTSDVGSIRGDFTIDSYYIADLDKRSVRNLIHASGNSEEAEKEIPIWFKSEELLNYRLINEAILYDVNLDGILE